MGIVLGAWILAGVWAANIAAHMRHEVFVGANYKFIAIDTIGQTIVLVFLTVFGVIFAFRYWR